MVGLLNVNSPTFSSPDSPLVYSKSNNPNNSNSSPPGSFHSSTQTSTTMNSSTSTSTTTTLASSTTSTRSLAGASQNGIDKELANPFPEFSHQEILATPYEAELKRDEEFQAQMQQMLLDLILEVHAWSTSKPENESAAAGDALFEEAQNILRREQEQGMFSSFCESSRLRLLEFITKIKTALAALTSFL